MANISEKRSDSDAFLVYLSYKDNNYIMKVIITEEQYKRLFNEVRYIDTRTKRGTGKQHAEKNDYMDVYNQDPIKNGDKIRVFHGCTLETACSILIQGTSGKVYHPRTYSYESGMNPLGMFVTTDFDTAKKFGTDNRGMAIIEFTANASDLESPVWNGQDSYFGQYSNPQPFKNRDERDAQKMNYKEGAKNTPDEKHYDVMKRKDYTIDMSYVRDSDKPEMAYTLFNNAERQALFMGDLNPNQIKRIWVKLPGKEGYVRTSDNYQPMTPKQFLRKFGNKEWFYTWKDGKEQFRKITKEKWFYPNEDCKSFDDLVQRVYDIETAKGWPTDMEDLRQGLELMGMLQTPPSPSAYQDIKLFLWPKQIIQLYGREYFNDNFDRLGQLSECINFDKKTS